MAIAVSVMVVDDGDADAGRDDQLEPVQRDRTGRLGEAGVRRTSIMSASVSRDADEGELVTGQPGQHVVGPLCTDHPAGELDEQLVAGVVAERVVHLLEAVEVEHHHEADTVARPILGDLGDLLFERRPVRQAGERILASLAFDPLVEQTLAEARRELFGEVLEPHDVVGRRTGAPRPNGRRRRAGRSGSAPSLTDDTSSSSDGRPTVEPELAEPLPVDQARRRRMR